MHIEQSQVADLDTLMEIYEDARLFMVDNGNPTQWPPGYPSESAVLKNIQNKESYVLKEDGIILATFHLPFGNDPTYQEITEPGWLNDAPYGAIHQVAVNKKLQRKGLGMACLKAAETLAARHRVKNLRIDTHTDNVPMQKSIMRNGYTYCGVITVRDGSSRLAYQKVLKQN